MKKEKKVFLSIILMLLAISLLSLVSAECNIRIYVYNDHGEMAPSKVYSFCEASNLNNESVTKDFYTYTMFGGRDDSCESLCDNVWIYAKNEDNKLGGYAIYYPMNNSKFGNWSKGYETQMIKIIMQENIDPLSYDRIKEQNMNSSKDINNSTDLANAADVNITGSNIPIEPNVSNPAEPSIAMEQNNVANTTEPTPLIEAPTLPPIPESKITGSVISEGFNSFKYYLIYGVVGIIVVILLLVSVMRIKNKKGDSPSFNPDMFR